MYDHTDSISPAGNSEGPGPAPGSAGKALSPHQALIAHRDAMVAAAAQAGITALEIKYFGQSDEGATEDVVVNVGTEEDESFDLDEVLVDTFAFERHWQFGLGDFLVAAPARRRMSEVLEEMLDLALSASGHAEFECGDGGHGSMSLNLETGELTLDHNDFYLEAKNSFHDLSDIDVAESSTAPLHDTSPSGALDAPACSPAADGSEGDGHEC